jgi:hypothetical protein
VNRRGFLSSVLQAGVAAAFLPGAVTYARRWKRTPAGLLVSEDPVVSFDVLLENGTRITCPAVFAIGNRKRLIMHPTTVPSINVGDSVLFSGLAGSDYGRVVSVMRGRLLT